MTLCKFTVPGAPVPKGRARVVRSKSTGQVRGITPARTVNFEATVRIVAASARPSGWPMQCEYKVWIHAVRATRNGGDNSNIAKAIEDACNTVLWVDDRQVCEVHVTRDLDPSNPRTEVRIEAVPVRCVRCHNYTLLLNEDRCPDCHSALEAKRAQKPRKSA